MAVILFYSPFDQRSRDTESLMIAFREQNHRVLSLSQASGHLIHDYLRDKGIETYTHMVPGKQGIAYSFKHILFFIHFCWKHKIEVVYSHLESANLVASIGQFFVKAKVYLCRHHIDLAALQNFDKSFFYRLTYHLGKKIIVVSDHAKRYMISREGIDERKIIHINLAYDFKLYSEPDKNKVYELKKEGQAQLTMISIGRFVSYKRIHLSLHVLKKIVASGINARLFLLGDGPEVKKIKAMIRDYSLQSRVVMPGYVQNVNDYLAASDFLLHPSTSESSCVVVKEAAITRVPIVVCENVGDFDDYIVNGLNGFVTSQENFVDEASEIVMNNFAHKNSLQLITENLHKSVWELFSLQSILPSYEMLNRRD